MRLVVLVLLGLLLSSCGWTSSPTVEEKSGKAEVQAVKTDETGVKYRIVYMSPGGKSDYRVEDARNVKIEYGVLSFDDPDCGLKNYEDSTSSPGRRWVNTNFIVTQYK